MFLQTDLFTYIQTGHASPTQGEGEIFATGESFHFRYRSGHVSLIVMREGDDAREANIVAEFKERIHPDFEGMPPDMVEHYLISWLSAYVAGHRFRQRSAAAARALIEQSGS